MHVICNRCGATFSPQSVKVEPKGEEVKVFLVCPECRNEELVVVVKGCDSEERR